MSVDLPGDIRQIEMIRGEQLGVKCQHHRFQLETSHDLDIHIWPEKSLPNAAFHIDPHGLEYKLSFVPFDQSIGGWIELPKVMQYNGVQISELTFKKSHGQQDLIDRICRLQDEFADLLFLSLINI